jgi:hypothetical protein
LVAQVGKAKAPPDEQGDAEAITEKRAKEEFAEKATPFDLRVWPRRPTRLSHCVLHQLRKRQ